MRFLLLVAMMAACAGCTTAPSPRAAVPVKPVVRAEVPEPIEAGIVPLTLEQDREISGVR